MKTFLFWSILIGCSFSLTAQQAGDLDPYFGQNGKRIWDWEYYDLGAWQSEINHFESFAVQGDGKIVVVGQCATYPFMMRLLPDGKIDSSFAAFGLWIDTGHPNSIFHDVVVAPNGYIYAAGQAYVNANTTEAMVAAVDLTGVMKPGFGNFGFVTKTLLLGQNFAKKILLQADGKLVIGGGAAYQSPVTSIWTVNNFVFRLHPDGSDDGSLGTMGTGYATAQNTGYVCDMAMKNGTLALAFSTQPYYHYYSGQIDISMLDLADGLEVNKATCRYYAGNVSCRQAMAQVAFAPDGTLWVAASYLITSNNLSEIDLFKVNPQISFGTFDMKAYTYYIYGVTGLAATNSQVYVSGYNTNGDLSYVLNFDSNANINLNFANNGILVTDAADAVSAMHLQLAPNNRLLWAGKSANQSHALSNTTNMDGYISQILTENSLSAEPVTDKFALKLFPNPNKGDFHIQLPQDEVIEAWMCLDASGRQWKLEVEGERLHGQLPQGWYALNIITQKGAYQSRFWVE